ncbi:hypothetical protein GZ77_07325 [Endozoicomonas montiporae]|uniref:Uncharacterized protein n=2 Tax=Endozoicomonas montiporae TaxID=1027273 RepID=A0A081N703_9GAMM|nr:hypothetical protein [Endozoicomonas montiporae]AMO55965.1 hypothetical protein EZMO1_1822 [Endozoicomonas montiporae CL-33]KEQ14226.1 hypothetical protein GZ77_07325 [Endozoicomonas montiporae]
MTYVNTRVLKKYAEFRGFLLRTGTIAKADGGQIVWLLKGLNTPELVFDTAWDVLEGLDWLRENRDEACRLLRKRRKNREDRAAAVGQDSSAVWIEHC